MAGGAFVTDEGRTRLVVIEPRGHAFDSREAARFTMEAEASLERVRAREPLASLDLTGGHVVATQTESLMRTDLEKSSVLALVLASLVFVVTFRRVRALVAVLPPLVIGTLWTTALAALVYPHLSAVATAFSAVVIGVGVDTGVHVYGRLLRARREGLSSRAAADSALRETWRPTLGAALAAGGAFGCLALSDIEGMRQLGVLCAAGEVLTALAILAVVPEVGALLERGPRPPLPRASWVASLTKTRGRALIAIALVAVAIALSLSMGPPRIDHAVVRFDARALPALKTYAEIDAAFGGDREQWIVVSADRDLSHARSRAEAVAEAADRLVAGGSIAGFDALARLAPSSALQQRRLVERDRLDLPSRKALLARILAEEGFAVDAFDRALESFANPSNDTSDVLADDRPGIAWLRRRYLATDDRGALAVTYVRTSMATDGDDSRVILRAADPEAVVTGFADLERNLTRTLGRDLRRVLAGAACVVFLVLGVTLRRPSRVALALLVLFVEIVVVVALSGPLGIRWHVYDALVLPVLLGITLDEVLFLLDAAERTSIDEAIAEQAPLGTATALTTAFGFGALLVCRFDGLVDVGKVGALGSVIGLVLALVVVPATYRLFVWKK